MLTHDTLILAAKSAQLRWELRKILEENYNILEASGFEQLLVLAEENAQSLATVIIDVEMTVDGSGDSALAKLKEDGFTGKVPLVAVITEKSSTYHEKFAIDMGVGEIILYPLHAPVVKHRIANTISLFYSKENMQRTIDKQAKTIHDSYEAMVDTLSSIIEYRDVESGQHVLRIRRYTRILLEEVARNCPEYMITREMIQAISSASALHDVGKISIPDNILNKPEALTFDEFEIMKTHTVTGANLLAEIKGMGDDDYMRYAYNICRYHHERYDGSGYPDGLSGEQIPICAQVVGLVDAYDALTTDRVYKKAIPYIEASNMIINGECGVFSAKLIECFKHVRGKFEELGRSYSDGYSPESDSITVPLPPPEKTTSSSIEEYISRNRAILHLFNVTCMEVDLDERVYHLIYDPHLELSSISGCGTFEEAMLSFAQNSVHPEDRYMITDDLHTYLDDFFKRGLRKSSRHYRIRGIDGIYRENEASVLRITAPESDSRKAIVVWKRTEDAGAYVTRSTAQGRYNMEFAYDNSFTLKAGADELCAIAASNGRKMRPAGSLSELMSREEFSDLSNDIEAQLLISRKVEADFPARVKNGKLRFIFVGELADNADGSQSFKGDVVCCEHSYKKRQKELDSLVLYRDMIEQTGDVLFEWDLINDVMHCSENWEKIFGYPNITDNAFKQFKTNSHLHPDDVYLFLEKVEQIKRRRESFVELSARIADSEGKYIWNRIRMTSQTDAGGVSVKIAGIISDIDAEKRISQSFLEKSERDALTKLLNKEAGRNKVNAYLNGDKPSKAGAFIIIDLDNFKDINDRFGHLFGDSLLANVSEAISGMFRESDTVARIGGDEFLAFMPDVSDKGIIATRCNGLIKTVAEMYKGKLGEIELSCSVGVSLMPENGTEYSELFQRADTALYQAKNDGRNCWRLYDGDQLRPDFSAISRRIDSDQMLGMAGNGLTEYVFQRLYETNDIEGTINSVLELIGKQLNVSRVYIFENNDDNTACSNTFEWCNEGIASEKDNLQNISYDDLQGYVESFDERGLMYCTDVKELADHIRAIVEPQGIRSMLHCAIREKGVFRGYVGIDDCLGPRFWMKEHIETTLLLSQMVSVFILKLRNQQRSEELLADMKNVLDSQFAYVYVVNPEDHTMHFINSKVMELVSDIELGSVCYKSLLGFDSPCENCPILQSENGGSCIIKNPVYGLTVRVNATPIRWCGKKEWLITCVNENE